MNLLIKQLALATLLAMISSCKQPTDRRPNQISVSTPAKAQRPEDILPNEKETVQLTFGNKTVVARKGTLAAAFANARLVRDPNAKESTKAEAWKWIKENALTIASLMGDEVKFTDQRIQSIIDAEKVAAFATK